MKRNMMRWVLIGTMMALGATACSMPGAAAPTPFEFPTPNLTLTAIFQPTATVNAAPTATAPLPFITPATPTGGVTNPNPQPSSTSQAPAPAATSIPPSPLPTRTSAPMATQAPVSYAGPGVRGGTSMTATYLNQPPNIDGSFGDWYIDKYAITSIVYGANNYTGESDLSARVMLGWDANNLYVAVRVKDDIYVQNAKGANLYKGDSLELLVDNNVPGDYYLQALNSDDYQLGISAGPQPGSSPEAYLWYPQSMEGSRQNVKVGAVKTDDGYRVEAAIPWSTFAVTAHNGQHLGFAFSVSDNDNQGANVQQSMVSSSATRVVNNPTTWGDLTLGGAGSNPPPTNRPPTNTPAPNPSTRPGASVNAIYMSSPPVLDGVLSEWSASKYPLNTVVFGADKWTDAADLSGSLMAGWDNNNIYLAVPVVDNRYVQLTSGENLFLGDSLEVLLDANLPVDYYDRNLNSDDYQIGISPGNPQPGSNPQAYLWFPKSKAGGLSQAKIAAVPTSNGYIVEAAIPWSVFGISPAGGQHYGFAVSISDDDNTDKAIQQTMVSNISKRVLTDPTSWGDLTLSNP